ncbi:MAG: hypothetical protein ACXWWE_08360, partial [Nitrospira sp.]
TSLEGLSCRRCGHRGMKARDGLQLLFARQYEYVFIYGPSLSCLKVLLSTVVVNLFSGEGMTPVRLATHIAEWALLRGQVCGTVRPSGDLVLSSCYDYCRRQALAGLTVSSMQGFRTDEPTEKSSSHAFLYPHGTPNIP